MLLSKISLFFYIKKVIVSLIVIKFYIDFYFECSSYIPYISFRDIKSMNNQIFSFVDNQAVHPFTKFVIFFSFVVPIVLR